MPLSPKQLLKSQTEEQILNFLLDTLRSLGWSATSWQDGAVQRNILTAAARLGAIGSDTIANLVEMVLTKPEGDWLDIRGVYFLKLPRLEAVKAERDVTLTNAPSSPPYVLTTLTAITAKGQRFFPVTAPGTLNPGDTITIEVIAENGGVDGNTIATPKVPGMGGITAVWSGDPTVPGVDRESDDRYRMRQDLRLSELTYSVGLRAYELWALTAAPSVVRVRAINNYPTENDVRVVLDPGTPAEILLVQDFLAGRRPPNDIVTVQAANIVPYTIRMAPRVRKGTTEASMLALLLHVVNQDMPIGGWVISEGVAGRLLREKLSEALLCKNGAYSATVVTPATDLILGATDVIDPTFIFDTEVIP